MNSQVGPLQGLLMGIGFALFGALLASDFGGHLTVWWKKNLSGPRPLRKVPPWRWLPEPSLATLVGMFRLAGALVCLVGTISVILSVGRLA